MAAALRAAHPGLEVELVGIETRGDRVLDKPLSEIEGKEFFTAELDHALAEGRVDFTVHSLKDLALERPPDFVLAAVPRRANPRDLALFAPDVPRAAWPKARGLRIGTSSPRRAQLLPDFFARALPHAARGKSLTSRICAAMWTAACAACMNRAAASDIWMAWCWPWRACRACSPTPRPNARGVSCSTSLLEGLHLMVLPLSESPGAPGQGALAIECRADDADTRALLAVLEDPPTRARVAHRTRSCWPNTAVAATSASVPRFPWLPDLGGLLRIAGRNAHDQDIAERALPARRRAAGNHRRGARLGWQPRCKGRGHTAARWRRAGAKLQHDAVFVAHSRALPAGGAAALAGKKVWTSGTKSWFALAAQGVWVQGCSEGLGAEAAAQLVAEPLLRLPPPGEWDALTHAAAVEPWQAGSWAGANVIATYAVSESELPEREALAAATHVFWSSTAQFERGRQFAQSGRLACQRARQDRRAHPGQRRAKLPGLSHQ